MSRCLGISRTAVWKHVSRLRHRGYVIDAVPNKGYRLVEELDLPVSDEIKRFLRTENLGCEIVFMNSVDSTNRLAQMLAAQGAAHGTVVTADSQTKGRGRRGREWSSPPGSNLYISIILRPGVYPAAASQIPILSVLASVRAIERMAPPMDLKIKWPNDIYCEDRKLSGTLCEMKAEMDRVEYVVVGTGINANILPSEGKLPSSATSILAETGTAVSRAGLAASLLEEFELLYKSWLSRQDLSAIMPLWKKYSMLLGRPVTVTASGRRISGRSRGISPDGALNLEVKDGSILPVYAGDATLSPGR